jgi:hypothetical protein
MRRNSTTERPVATRKIATHINMAPALAALVARSTKTVPAPGSKAHLSAVQQGCPFMQPPPSRLAPGSWLKCSRIHFCYSHDNVVFFRWTRFVHLGAGYGFLFRSLRQLAKAQCKCSLSADVTDHSLVLKALTLCSRHRRRTDLHSTTAFSRRTAGHGSRNKYFRSAGG